NMAWWLLQIIKILKLKRLRKVDVKEITVAARRLAHRNGSETSRPVAQLFTYAAKKWLRFHGKLKPPRGRRQAFSRQLEAFNQFMQDRNFRSSTMESDRWRVSEFLNWFADKHRRLSRLTILDVDRFLGYKLATGSAPPTLKSISGSLRTFLYYAESRKWCPKGIASLTRGPAVGR